MMNRVTTLLLVVLLTACATTSAPTRVDGVLAAPVAPPTSTTTPPTTTSTTTAPEIPYTFHGDLEPHASLVALLTEPIEVYASPDAAEPFRTQKALTWFGANQVLTLVAEPVDGWAEVLLPGRPNNRTGWVRADDLHYYVVGTRIVIDLSERSLVYYVDGEEVLRTTVAVGTERNPTPTGRFFVTDSVRVANPKGPFGPYALALSARSDTITEFNGGDGIIGIHGTNRPNLLGEAVSLGCIRLRNDVMTRLWEMVPVGTPVDING